MTRNAVINNVDSPLPCWTQTLWTESVVTRLNLVQRLNIVLGLLWQLRELIMEGQDAHSHCISNTSYIVCHSHGRPGEFPTVCVQATHSNSERIRIWPLSVMLQRRHRTCVGSRLPLRWRHSDSNQRSEKYGLTPVTGMQDLFPVIFESSEHNERQWKILCTLTAGSSIFSLQGWWLDPKSVYLNHQEVGLTMQSTCVGSLQ